MNALPCSKLLNNISSFLKRHTCSAPDLLRKVLIGWLLAVTVEFLILPMPLRNLAQLEGLARMSGLRIGLLTAAVTAVLLALSRFKPTSLVERWALVGIFALLAVAALWISFTWAYLAVCLLAAGLFAVYGRFGWDQSQEPVTKPQSPQIFYGIITICVAFTAFLLLSIWTVSRVYTMSSSTYDFGIFAQMFYNMKETGLPMTTLERDGWLSHFDVHVSPIYYLMLPFYMLFPTPATLQVLQAAVMASAAIPMWKIGKHHGLSGLQRLLLCTLLMVYPAFFAGASYDIHENCFLTPLILWLFYAIDRKSTLLTAIFALLTLMVKEDAAVYVAVIALYLILNNLLRWKKADIWGLIAGFSLLALSLSWFLAVTAYLANHGDGVMNYRYKNFFYDGSKSLVSVIKAVLLNPMKAVYECVDTGKLVYIAQTMLPLLGLPLLTRRYQQLVLLIPYILINLMSDYKYQHDIFFQYNYGSVAFLMYLCAINLAEIKFQWVRTAALSLAMLLALTCFYKDVWPTVRSFPQWAKQYRSHYQTVKEALDTIPKDASVVASGFYTTHLSQRETIYDIYYCSQEHLLEAEYVALEENLYKKYASFATQDNPDGFLALQELLIENGFEVYHQLDDILIIYKKA